MFCPKCGTTLPEGAAFCTNCGQQFAAAPAQPAQPVYQAPQQPAYQQPQQPAYQQPAYQPQQPVYQQPVNGEPHHGHVGFGEAIKLFFTNYANFNGRASRSEYWFAYLFIFLVTLVTSWIPVLGWLISVALLVPNLSITVRRLHDIGKSWVWILMGLIPLAGTIILIVYMCTASVGDNQWGPGPRMAPPPYGYQPPYQG